MWIRRGVLPHGADGHPLPPGALAGGVSALAYQVPIEPLESCVGIHGAPAGWLAAQACRSCSPRPHAVAAACPQDWLGRGKENPLKAVDCECEVKRELPNGALHGRMRTIHQRLSQQPLLAA